MVKRTLNVDRRVEPTVDEIERKKKRNKIIAVFGLFFAIIAGILIASPLALGDLETEHDGIAPIVTSNKGDLTLINNGDFEFFVESDIAISSFLLHYNGSSTFQSLSSPYIYPVSLNGIGSVSFIIVVYDVAELRSVTTFDFQYDTISPSISISPTNGSSTEDNEFSITTSPDVDTVVVTSTDGYSNTFNDDSFTVIGPWTSFGVKTITVNATDFAGNSKSSIFVLTFSVEPPTIICDPITNSSIITINVSVYTILVKVGNMSSAIDTIVHSPYIVDMNWSIDGIHEIWVYVDTSVGTSYTINRTVIFDTIIPSFIVSPMNNSIVNSTLMMFTIFDATTVQAFVNGTNITTTMTYTPSCSVDGIYSFDVTMIDAAGNVNHSILSYTFNFKLPDIYISPVNGSTTGNNAFSIVTDTDVVEVRIVTDNNFTMYTPSFTITNPWNTTGTKTMIVTAIDIAGNSNTTTFILYFDIPEPYILYDPITNSSNFTIIVNDYTDTVMVGNTSSTINTIISYPYNVDMNWSTDGIHEMWVYINTTVGESYILNITVRYDTTDPMFIVSPINGSIVNMTTLIFTPIDATSVQAFVNGTNITSTMTYTPSWVSNGTYSFNVVMIDAAGNVNVSTLIYILDTDFPIITLLYIVNGSTITNSTITVKVTDASLVSVSYSMNNITFTSISSINSPRFSVDLSSQFGAPGMYDVHYRAIDSIGHTTYTRYRFAWSIISNITIIHPTNSTVPVYANPSGVGSFSTNKTQFLGYFKQTSFNKINFTIPYVTNASWVYIYYSNVTGSEFSYSAATMNTIFNILHGAWVSHSSSYKPFTLIGSVFSMSSTTYLGGNSSWRIYIYYNTGVDEVMGTFVIVYDDKTPRITWTFRNNTTSRLSQNTYVNMTATDINLQSMHVLVMITNSSGTFVLYNTTVYGSKTAFFGLNFTQVESRLSYQIDAYLDAVDLAGNHQLVHLRWNVDAKNTPDRNYWNYLWGLGVPAIVIFGILGYALKKSKNNGSSIGGI